MQQFRRSPPAVRRPSPSARATQPVPVDVDSTPMHTVEGSTAYRPRRALAFPVVTLPPPSDRIVTAVSSAMAAGVSSTDLLVQFPDDGFVVGLKVGAVEPSGVTLEVANSVLGVQVFKGDRRAILCSDGRTEQPCSAALLCGALSQNEHPIFERVIANDIWRVRFQNLSGAVANLKGQLAFSFRADIRNISEGDGGF